MKISVILVNYNGKKYNDACIKSVLDSTIGEQIQVVIVDNASTDDSLAALRDRWGGSEQIHIIALEKNFGFSRANNEGIRWSVEAGIEYFLLLNNDTEVKTDTIEKMFLCHQKTDKIVVPKVYYADRRNTIWCAGGDFTPVIRKTVQRGLNQPDRGQYQLDSLIEAENVCSPTVVQCFCQKRLLTGLAFWMNVSFYIMRILSTACGRQIRESVSGIVRRQ